MIEKYENVQTVFVGQMSIKNMERFTNLRVILAQGPC